VRAASAQQPQLVATVRPDGGSSSTVVVPKIATTHRLPAAIASGASAASGMVWARVIYKANREQIRNPNLIHPGQIFVLPARWILRSRRAAG